jgi:hypothetical protein
MGSQFSADSFTGGGIEYVTEIKFEDSHRKMWFGSGSAKAGVSLAHEGMNDNICSTGDTDGKLVGKEMCSETGSIDTGDVTAKKTAFAITKSDWAKFVGVGGKIFVKGHEIVSRESFAKVRRE